MAVEGNPNNVEFEIGFTKKNGIYIIKTSELIVNIISLLEEANFKKEDIAAKFQIELGKTFARAAIQIAKENNVGKIGLSGGVAYNYSFSKAIKDTILNSGFVFLEHEIISPGDAGISTGQLVGGLFNYYDKIKIW